MEAELDFCVISKAITWNSVGNMALYSTVKFFHSGTTNATPGFVPCFYWACSGFLIYERKKTKTLPICLQLCNAK